VKKPIPFGKYYLLERVNVGGMAEVFKAKTFGVEGFERLLAVKRILPNIAEDEEFITMFIDEAKIAVQLNHANIAQIFDLGKVEGSFFIALEYVHGKDVRAIFDRCRSLSETMPVPQACFMVMKVCEGLDYAHNKRDSAGREMHLVHRDVSPQNVLISYEGEVKLVDFGIAKAAGKASKTQAGILKGKFGYMSPEQVRGLPLDRRSDIFSVGIVLYELLTGERLFTGESDFSTLEKVRNVEILPPSAYNRKIPEQLEQIVLKALAKDVDDRYHNAIDLHDDLQAFMYTSGDFYSRKDLAGWMKRTFAREIEEEGRKLEEYRQLPQPDARAVPPPPPTPDTASIVSKGNGRPAPGTPGAQQEATAPEMSPANSRSSSWSGAAALAAAHGDLRDPGLGLSWDEEEIETQIYDKPSPVALPMEDTARRAVAAAKAVAEEDEATPTPALVPIIPRRTTQEVVPPPVFLLRGQGKGRLGLWLTVALAALVLCVGAVYYTVTAGRRPGNIAVSSDPASVEVFLDGKRQPGTGTPQTIRSLKPGFYIVRLMKPGYERWTQTVEVKPGETARLTSRLVLLATASIELHTIPRDAEALLDGSKLGPRTPLRVPGVVPGKHRLEVRKPPYQPWTQEFEVRPGQALQLEAKLLPLEVEVHLTSKPQGAAFLEREGRTESIGVTPVKIKLDPKFSYSLSVRKAKYRTWTRPVAFEGDGPVQLDATLEKEIAPAPEPLTQVEPPPAHPRRPRPAPKTTPKRQPPPPPTTPPPTPPVEVAAGTLLINSNPAARIVIDGKDTGLWVPQKKIPLPAGSHTVTLRNPKFAIDDTFTVTIKPGQPTKVIKTYPATAP
jgi:serine/threonine protein kinase